MAPTDRSARLLACLILVLAVALVFARTAGHEFVEYDTSLYITTNPRVLTGLSWDNARWAFAEFYAANWHPLTWLAHQLDVELFGLDPTGHHLVSVTWHAANACAVFVLFTRLGLRHGLALWAALLFAVHPLRAESVAWVVERKDLMSAYFGLLALLAWLSWVRTRSAWRYALALLAFAASLMSKPMLVTLPCVLLLFDVWPLARVAERGWPRLLLEKLPFFAVTAAMAWVAVRAQAAHGAVQGLADLDPLLRAGNAVISYAWYVAKSVWPSGLAFHYPLWRANVTLAAVLGCAAILVAVSAMAWRARKREPGVWIGWLFFLGTLVPVIGLLQVGAQARADRFTYLPGLGLAWGVALAAERWVVPRVGARAAALAGTAVVLVLAALGWKQVGTWRDTRTMCEQALRVTQQNNVAHDLLGIHLVERGGPEALDAGIAELRKALAIAPLDPDALANLGAALLRRGENREAEQRLQQVIEIAPSRAQPWSHLGGLHYMERRFPEAEQALRRALELEPDHVGAWSNLGLVLEALGRPDEARAAYEHALAVHADAWNARLSLARMFLRQRQPEAARPHFERVLARDPDQIEALRGLERVHLFAGELEQAYRCVERALALRPDSAPLLADKAWILAVASTPPLAAPEAARELAQRAVARGGEQPALLDALALAQAAAGDFEGARANAERALELVRAAQDPEWARRLELRLAAYRAGTIDRETPR